MSRAIALCLDQDSLQHPEYLGLEGEMFQQQSWLDVYESGISARSSLKDDQDVNEVWVISCNDIEPINLAASLKSDRPDLPIKLVASAEGGSLRSRARNANIDEVMSFSAFVRIYTEAKRKAHAKRDGSSLARLQGLPDPRVALPERTESECNEASEDWSPTASVMRSSQSEKLESLSRDDASRSIAASSPLVETSAAHAKIKRMHKGFLMSIVSGSGGSGKSTISVLAALEAAQRGYRTLLLDYDLQFGDISYVLRNIPSTNVDKALSDTQEKEHVFTQEAPLVVVGAPERFETSETIISCIADFTEEAAQYFDVIIVNTGANWSELHAILLERSSATLFLIDQRSSSLRACSHALELCARCGIASIPFKFALNKCAKNAPFSVNEVATFLQDAHVFELKDGGNEVEEYLASGNAFELRGRGNDLVSSVSHLMSQVLPQIKPDRNLQSAVQTKLSFARRHGLRKERKRAKASL